MKRLKKYCLAVAAVLAMSMAAPQSANACVYRMFQPVDQDFYLQIVYDDESGVFAVRLMDWDGEEYATWVF